MERGRGGHGRGQPRGGRGGGRGKRGGGRGGGGGAAANNIVPRGGARGGHNASHGAAATSRGAMSGVKRPAAPHHDEKRRPPFQKGLALSGEMSGATSQGAASTTSTAAAQLHVASHETVVPSSLNSEMGHEGAMTGDDTTNHAFDHPPDMVHSNKLRFDDDDDEILESTTVLDEAPVSCAPPDIARVDELKESAVPVEVAAHSSAQSSSLELTPPAQSLSTLVAASEGRGEVNLSSISTAAPAPAACIPGSSDVAPQISQLTTAELVPSSVAAGEVGAGSPAPPARPPSPEKRVTWGASFGLGLLSSPAALIQISGRASPPSAPFSATATANAPVLAVSHVREVEVSPLSSWFLSNGMPCFDRGKITAADSAEAALQQFGSTIAWQAADAPSLSFPADASPGHAALSSAAHPGGSGRRRPSLAHVVQASLSAETDASARFSQQLADALVSGMNRPPAWLQVQPEAGSPQQQQ